MTSKKEKFAKWIWQDYTGAKWNNLTLANTRSMSGDVSYCYPQGYNSKSAYRPKSVFYHYQVTGIDPNVYKLNKVTFKLVMGRKTSTKTNALPSIKVFTGDNNAPYKKSPLYTTSQYETLSNYYEFDTYTLVYAIKNVTISDLKNLIVELDWAKTKVKGESVVSINRAEVVVNYEKKTPKWSLYETINKSSATTNDKVAWKLTMKNTGGICANNTVTLSLPKGVSVVSSTGGGTYNTSTKTWTMNNVCAGKSVTRTFYIKSSSVGLKTLTALNNSVYATNKNVTRQVSFIKYVKPVVPVAPVNRDDVIIYTPYETFEKEQDQYFDVQIQGMRENHPFGGACYVLSTSNNVLLNTPLRLNAELLEEGNENIKEMVTDDTVTYEGITVELNDNTICFKLDDINSDFVANVRVYMYCTDDTEGTVTISANNKTYTDTFDILPKRGAIFNFEESISRDKSYVINSVNIGSPLVWTLRAKSHRHNFFDEKKDLMEIEIEKEIAYIGVIPLSRCHKADVTADSKNTLIENRYLNRAYYGKKGDYSENIKMTLRMKWQDVATLQGLCEMDKPIPIDTIPYFPDGDPLNHRGWAEIHGVTNIKKINDMLYECDVEVTYLTHNILTKFNITEAKKITEAGIKYYLSLIHNWNDDLLDIFRLNYYEFYTTLTDANDDDVGYYEIEPNANLTFSRDLNKNSTYDILWRNSLPVLMSSDYDGNWEMSLRVKDKNNNNTTVFEHNYSNYKHYDYDEGYAVNTADATTKYLNGSNYETLNFEKVGLGFDNLAPLIEDNKVATHFNTMEDVVIDDPSEKFEIFLLDKENNGVANQTVEVLIDSDDFNNRFNVLTDRYGRIFFDVAWGNGEYTVTLNFKETDDYRSCTYSANLSVEFDYVEYHFNYPQNPPTYYDGGNEFVFTLLDSSDEGVADNIVHYSWKRIGEDYGHEETVTTNESGEGTIPIIHESGSFMLRVNFKGYSDNGTVYQPVQFEQQINILNTRGDVSIEADNIVLVQGDNEKQYNIILKNSSGTPLGNEEVIFYFYNNDDSFKVVSQTNAYGVASVPLYLKGGAYNVDIVYEGSETYNPLTSTCLVTVVNFERLETDLSSENLALNENQLLDGNQDYYTLTLIDENKNPVAYEPISVIIFNSETTSANAYVDTVVRTDSDGKVAIPFITHGENVIIQATYQGSVKYKGTVNEDYVTFDEIPNKTEQILDVASDDYYGQVITLTKGGVLQDSWESDFAIISTDDYRFTSWEEYTNQLIEEYKWISNTALPLGTHNVTIFKKGDNNNYSVCRTLNVNRLREGRGSWDYWVRLQGFEYDSDAQMTHEVLSNGANGTDDYMHIRFKFNFWIPNGTLVEAKTGYVSTDNYDKLYKTVTKETTDETGRRITYFDVYGVFSSTKDWYFKFYDSYAFKTLYWDYEIPVTASSKTAITVSQTGFAYHNETYQDIAVSIANSSSPDTTIYYDEGFYIIKCFNLETYEELYYYSYITDNLKDSKINFRLNEAIGNSGDNWQIEIIVNDNEQYKGAYYTTTGRITTESKIIQADTTVFNDPLNYINDGSLIQFNENGFYYRLGGN